VVGSPSGSNVGAGAIPETPANRPNVKNSERWIIVASRSDLRDAISVAQEYKRVFPDTMVMRSENGQYGVVIGRLDIGQNPSVLIDLVEANKIPKDAYLAPARRFSEVAWP
jgi:hypothetical protein